MSVVTARSAAPTPAALLRGRPRSGVGLGHGFFDAEGYVLALTGLGAPRLPNGLELAHDVVADAGARVRAGRGALRFEDAADLEVRPGPRWDPRPAVRFVPVTSPALEPSCLSLVGWGPGLTPLGDDLLCGYLAGLALLGVPAPSTWLPPSGATTTLSHTLLRHARRGQLCEPAHAMMGDGDLAPLLSWGHTSGRALLLGFACAARELCGVQGRWSSAKPGDSASTIELSLPSGTRCFDVSMCAVGPAQ